MAEPIGIRELLEAGVHFGHQTRRWNPKMRRFIHGERDGIYIIDLLKTETLLDQAQEFAASIARRGGTVLFVGTKKQARDGIKELLQMATDVGIRELLEAGVHFGHQTRRWNPKMRRFIHGERSGIYIIDLLKTQALLAQACMFAGEVASRGGTVLFVGTKKTARDAVQEVAEAAGMPYVNHRWLGGLLTNFQTISQRIKRLHDLERYETEGQLGLLEQPGRLEQVDDVDARALAVDEAAHLRVPTARLVAEVHSGLEQLLEACLWHRISLFCW